MVAKRPGKRDADGMTGMHFKAGVAGRSDPEPPNPQKNHADIAMWLDRIGAQVEVGFREAAAAAIRQAHAVGVPVATLDAQGRVVWLHSDGVRRTTREPI